MALALFGVELSDSGRGMWKGTDEETEMVASVTRDGARGYWADIYSADRGLVEGPYRESPEAAVDALHALVRDLAARVPK